MFFRCFLARKFVLLFLSKNVVVNHLYQIFYKKPILSLIFETLNRKKINNNNQQHRFVQNIKLQSFEFFLKSSQCVTFTSLAFR